MILNCFNINYFFLDFGNGYCVEMPSDEKDLDKLLDYLFSQKVEWNKAKIMVYKGTVVHGQNDENVLEYHLWTKQWTDMLQASKFSEEKWPLAFELLNNCGGDNHEGFIGLQDHGDDVWFRNIRVKVLD